jgi:hypothetical protein
MFVQRYSRLVHTLNAFSSDAQLTSSHYNQLLLPVGGAQATLPPRRSRHSCCTATLQALPSKLPPPLAPPMGLPPPPVLHRCCVRPTRPT